MLYNQKTFPQLFGGDIPTAFAEAEESRKNACKNTTVDDGAVSKRRSRRPKNTTGEEIKEDSEENCDNDGVQEDLNTLAHADEMNAKKRAKQKAKKATTKHVGGENTNCVDDHLDKLAIDDGSD